MMDEAESNKQCFDACAALAQWAGKTPSSGLLGPALAEPVPAPFFATGLPLFAKAERSHFVGLLGDPPAWSEDDFGVTEGLGDCLRAALQDVLFGHLPTWSKDNFALTEELTELVAALRGDFGPTYETAECTSTSAQ
jgi:hypothetical protein